jgi:urease accessory protein
MSYAFACEPPPYLGDRAAPPPFTICVAGPAGAGKTSLVALLTRALRQRWRVAAVAPRKDVAVLRHDEAIGAPWVASLEEGGVQQMLDAHPDVLVVEGTRAHAPAPARADVVVGVFPVSSPEVLLADPLFFQAHLLVVNKTDLAMDLGVSVEHLARDIHAHRGEPFFFVQCSGALGLSPVIEWLVGAYSSQSTSLGPMVR